MESLLSEPVFTRRMKMLSLAKGFMLNGILGVDFFSTSELLYPKMKFRRRLIRARPNNYINSGKHNVSLGIVDCSLDNRIALKYEYNKIRMDKFAHSPVEFNYLEPLAKTFIISVRQNQCIQENSFNNAPVRWIAFAMNTNSALSVS